MTIYLDLIILANFLLDYCLIVYTGIINHQNVKFHRVLLATLVALSSLSLFFIPYKVLFITIRIILSLVIIFLAYSFRSWKQYVKNLLIFYFLNYVTAGVLVSFDFSITDNKINIIYNEPTTWYILVISFIFANILTYIYKVIEEMHGVVIKKLYDVKFRFLGRDYQVRGFFDTGNIATSLGDNIPIVFIDKELIPVEITELFLIENNIKFTYVITKTVNDSKLILAFQPEAFYLFNDEKCEVKKVYLALTDNINCSDKSFQVILNSYLI